MANERRESQSGYHYYGSYRDCPRQFYLKYLLGLKPCRTARALVKGGAMHEAFAAYWLAHEHEAEEVCLKAFEQEMQSRISEYDSFEDHEKDLDSGLKMLRKWIDTWGEYDRKHYDLLGVEKTYNIPFGPLGHQMFFTVRMDRIYRDKETAEVFPVESKTTGWSIIKMFENTARGDQITAQIWALQKMQPEWNCHSAIVDVLYNRGKVVDCDRPGPLVYRSEDALRIFEMGMYSTIVEITQKVKALGKMPWPLLFPPHKNFCRLFGCPYESVCDVNLKPGELPSGFVRDEWVSEEALRALRESQDWDLADWELKEEKEQL